MSDDPEVATLESLIEAMDDAGMYIIGLPELRVVAALVSGDKTITEAIKLAADASQSARNRSNY